MLAAKRIIVSLWISTSIPYITPQSNVLLQKPKCKVSVIHFKNSIFMNNNGKLFVSCMLINNGRCQQCYSSLVLSDAFKSIDHPLSVVILLLSIFFSFDNKCSGGISLILSGICCWFCMFALDFVSCIPCIVF